MPKFQIETVLPETPDQLSTDLLCMAGVNFELSPFLKMSAPLHWKNKPITEWPVNTDIFSSTIFLFGFIPVDYHRFKLLSVNSTGFNEASNSLMNSVWSHKRTMSLEGAGTRIKDVVYFKCRLSFLGRFLRPIYRAVFAHRHRRLKQKHVQGK